MSEPNDADRKKYLRRRIAAILFVALAVVLVRTCKRPPDIRRLCEIKCACGCNVDECVEVETVKRNRFRKDESCSKWVDEMTECEIENCACTTTISGGVTLECSACGQILTHLAGCGTLP